MTQAERRKLLSRRRQWQHYRASLLARGIDYDNPPGLYPWEQEAKQRYMQFHDTLPLKERIRGYCFDD